MKFWLAVASLARRWRVMLAVFLVACTVCAAVLMAVPTKYVSSATMVLTTTEYGGTESRDPASPTDLTNPMLNFSESLATTADMLIWSMSSRDVQESLSLDGSTSVLVDDGRTNPDLFGFNGPIIYITGESNDPDVSVAAVEKASDMVSTRLLEWQQSMNAPRSTFVTLVNVVAPTAAEARLGARVKLAATAWVAGFLLSLATAYLVMRIRERRTAPRQSSRAVQLTQPVSPPNPAPVPAAAGSAPAARSGRGGGRGRGRGKGATTSSGRNGTPTKPGDGVRRPVATTSSERSG